MTTEQIIKALECCYNPDKWCDNCPYDKLGGLGCKNKLGLDALALIKNQLGEIRGLNSAIETLQGVAKDYENHNENLAKENKYLRDRLAEEMEHAKDMKGIDDIVRCKDCIFCKHNSSALTYRCDRRGYYSEEVKESGFCSYGRRTDDEVQE